MSKVLVIGGGAAGMMAAIAAAQNGHQVHLYEKNEKLGKKIYITGKGRCNLTNACDLEDLFQAVVSNPKFLYSSFYSFSNQDAMEFFSSLGLKMKTERGNRVFPVSDHASDVIKALERGLKESGVKIHLLSEVDAVCTENDTFSYILIGKEKIYGDACIVCTGGVSYRTTGSTGDGYKFASACHHSVADPMPALVPLETQEEWVHDLQGLSLKNVSIIVKNGRKKLYEDFGEMLFTHFGVSGPMIISASSYVGKHLVKGPLTLSIDLKPALNQEQLDSRIQKDFKENINKQFRNALGKLYPSKLIPVIVSLSEINGDKPIHEVTKEERLRLVTLTKNLTMTITGTRDFNEAIITKGGVKVKEINPSTMESKLVSGLYFAGEVLDVDAKTGGYNLQIAWSTGHLAGSSIE